MSTDSYRQKMSTDLIENVIYVMRITTGEICEKLAFERCV